MSTALWQAQEWLKELRGGFYQTGDEAGKSLTVIAAAQVAQADAAERQAAAMEGIYQMLRYIAPAVEYQAAGDVSPEFKAGAAVDAVRADDVDSDPYGDGYNGPRAGHDQRDEDEQGYNAGIAPSLHR